MKSSAVYPGTFDPFTRGHEDIVRRAAGIFKNVVVAVAAHTTKTPAFPVEERVELARGTLGGLANVEIVGYSGLTVEFARARGLSVIVRGLRAVSDFEFEFQLANMSRTCFPTSRPSSWSRRRSSPSSPRRWCARSPASAATSAASCTPLWGRR